MSWFACLLLETCHVKKVLGIRLVLINSCLSNSKEVFLPHPWTPTSWQGLPIKQQPVYEHPEALQEVLAKISAYPPLVFSGEVDQLKSQLAKAGRGEAFLLQGGDCAERFQDCNQSMITNKIKIMLQMSVILCYGARKPVVRVGRIAGQYAKPRSKPTEVVRGQELPVFRGDNINGFAPSAESRKPDPNRLLEAYHHSALTLNYLRALTKGGFADLHYPEHWDLSFVKKASSRQTYEQIVANIHDAISFMESIGGEEDWLRAVDYYTSHEGLLLNYEAAQTRFVPAQNAYYNLGAHMLWIGDRTRSLSGAHMEYFRGIKNPIGLKVGPSAEVSDILAIIERLNPDQTPGRLVLISRFGKGQVHKLQPFVEAVKAKKLAVVWSVDPMHGNGSQTEDGIKTRDFGAILSELEDTLTLHKQEGSILGGVHFELTGDDVTECVGGASGLTVRDLDLNYETYCDPRLNYAQSLEMAFLISRMLQPA